MHGRSLAGVLRRRRWSALVAALAVAVVTVGGLLLAPRTYTATAMISATPRGSLAAAPDTARTLERTIAELARSVPVLVDVRSQVGTRHDVAQLQDEVHAHLLPGTVLIRIVVEDRDAPYARDVANAVAAALPRHDPSGGEFLFAGAGPATTPTSPSSPDIAFWLWLGLAAAVVAAVVAAFTREAVSPAVDDPGQLATLTGVPVLGEIARPADPETSDAAPLFRSARVALEFASSEQPTHTVVVAPAVADDAAAWVAVNLAAALAQVDHRVLVVDADFGGRPPHPALKASKGPGLADVLRGDVELRDAVRTGPVSGVSVLPAGRLRGTDAATLIELQFHKAIGQIVDEVDLVLVCAAPLAESDDARVMAAGNALVVTVPAGRLRSSAARQLFGGLARYRLRVAGTVLLQRARR